MTQDNVIDLKKPEPFIDDPITDILRNGARKLLVQSLVEIEDFLSQYSNLYDDHGRQRIIRNGIFLSVKYKQESARFQLGRIESEIMNPITNRVGFGFVPPSCLPI